MEVMGVVGVMVNCALIGMSGPVHRLFPDISTTQTVLLIIVLEVSVAAALSLPCQVRGPPEPRVELMGLFLAGVYRQLSLNEKHN